MNILFPYLARWHAANHTRFHHLLHHAAARGHEVTVVQMPMLTRSREIGFTEMQAVPVRGVRVLDLEVPRRLWRLRCPGEKVAKKLLFARLLRSQLGDLCRSYDIDILMGYNVPHVPLLRRFPGTRVFDIADDNVALILEEFPAGLNTLAAAAVRRGMAQGAAQADVTFTVSDRLRRTYPSAVLLPNGVPREWLTAPPVALGRPQMDRPVVGYVGAFEHFIDLRAVLEAAAALPELGFLLVGGGRLLAKTKEEIAQRGLRNCTLTGPVSYSEVPALIAEMDVCLCPFRLRPVSHAASPLKFFEYLALGRVVVASRTEELVRLASSACFFADGGGEIAQTLRGLQSGRLDWETRVNAARHLIAGQYNWTAIGDTMLETIQRAQEQVGYRRPAHPRETQLVAG